MPSKFAEVTSRNFSPKLTPELSDEARKAVNAAFDAMSTWRTETVDKFETVIDKMAVAARALGWPQQIVDATHAQMLDVIKMQIQTTDRLMTLGRDRSNHRARHRQYYRSCSPSPALARRAVGPQRKWRDSTPSGCICKSRNSGKRLGQTRWAFGPMPTNQSTGAPNCDDRDYYPGLVGLHAH